MPLPPPEAGHLVDPVVVLGEAVRALLAELTGEHRGLLLLDDLHWADHDTGRSFAVTQTHWFRYLDGRIVEHWANRDDIGMLRQLGVIG